MPKKSASSSERHLLSKTSFIKSIQCQKQVYLYKNRYFLRDKLTPEQLAVFKRGHRVGKLAWELFPGGIDASPKSPMQYAKALLQTQQLITENHPVIYEASFQHNRCLSILDMLVLKQGNWHAYEVKSSLSITETYLYDAAFQYYVMVGTGFIPESFSLIIVNKDYRLEEPFSAKDYFLIEDITEKVIALQPQIELSVEEAKITIQNEKSPSISIGMHCETPYKCDFVGFCRKYLPNPNVFSLTDLTSEERYRLYHQKKIKLDDIFPEDIEELRAKIQLDVIKTGKVISSVNHNHKTHSEIVFAYPVWDSPAIPVVKGTAPYTPVLLGLFIKSQENEKPEIYLFSKEQNYQDFLSSIQQKIEELTVVSYDFFEKNAGTLKPKGLVEIITMLKEKEFYHPQFMGDYTLNHVYNVLVEHKSDFKGNIANHEELKNHLWRTYEEQELFLDDVMEYAENQLCKIEFVWCAIHGGLKDETELR